MRTLILTRSVSTGLEGPYPKSDPFGLTRLNIRKLRPVRLKLAWMSRNSDTFGYSSPGIRQIRRQSSRGGGVSEWSLTPQPPTCEGIQGGAGTGPVHGLRPKTMIRLA